MKLSIITINYNNRAGLQKTIDSIIAQTCRNFEWIIIDGGSTDGSKELIKKNSEYFAYWCSEPDRGIYNAMNKGIAKAKGEYLLFLNSGDNFYDTNVLEKAWPYLKDYDFISGDSISYHKDGSVGPWYAPRHFTAYMIVNYSINHQSTFIRTELLRKRPYREDLKVVADWEQQLYELVLQDATYNYLPFVVSYFHEDGVSQKNLELHNHERQSVTHAYFSNRLLSAIRGENELKEQVNHLEYGTPVYKTTLFFVKLICKIIRIIHL